MRFFSLTTYIALIILLIVFQDIGARISVVVSPSMEDTLLVGDAMLILRYYYGLRLPFTDIEIIDGHKPAQNDIVLGSWPKSDRPDMVKRCVAVSGDTLAIVRKNLYVNGDEVPLPPGGKHDDPDMLNPEQAPRDFLPVRTIIGDSLFVLGDNRDFSYDSRLWGNLPEKRLRGKVSLILWSLDPEVSWRNPRAKFRRERFLRPIK